MCARVLFSFAHVASQDAELGLMGRNSIHARNLTLGKKKGSATMSASVAAQKRRQLAATTAHNERRDVGTWVALGLDAIADEEGAVLLCVLCGFCFADGTAMRRRGHAAVGVECGGLL